VEGREQQRKHPPICTLQRVPDFGHESQVQLPILAEYRVSVKRHEARGESIRGSRDLRCRSRLEYISEVDLASYTQYPYIGLRASIPRAEGRGFFHILQPKIVIIDVKHYYTHV